MAVGEPTAHPDPAAGDGAPRPSAPAPRRRRGWRTALWALVLVAAAFTPIALLGARSYQVAATAIRNAVNDSNASAADMAVEMVHRDLERGVQIAETTARLPVLIDAVRRHDEPAVRATLAATCDPSVGMARAYVTDPTGLLWSDYPRAPESLGRSFAHLDWYAQMFAGGPAGAHSVLSAVYQRNAIPRVLVVACAAPVRDGERLLGAVVYQYSLAEMSTRLARVGVGAGGHVYIVDHTGTLAAHPMLVGNAIRYGEYASAEPVRLALAGRTPPTVTYTDPATRRTMVATCRRVPVYGRPWVVVAQQPAEQAYAQTRSIATQIGLAAAILAVASIAFFAALARSHYRNSRLNEQLEGRNHDLHRMAAELRASVTTEKRSRTELQTTHDRLKATQSQLVQSEKLASLGQLVAGVAHEMNNPLAFVNNNLAILQRDMMELRDCLTMYREADDALAQCTPELLARIRAYAEAFDLDYVVNNLDDVFARSKEGVRRIQQIVKDLREFARQEAIGEFQKNTDVNAGVRSTLNMVQGRARKQRVTIDADLADDLPLISCQPANLNQVVLQLVTNAIDACAAKFDSSDIPEGEGGRVTVRTRPSPGGSGIEIGVTDNGTGIDSANVPKLFDPFFTTKPPGQGTGLGLSICQRVALDHGGRIEVESAPGQGATFVVHLPIAPPAARPASGRDASPAELASPVN